jgi:hypothetical protein
MVAVCSYGKLHCVCYQVRTPNPALTCTNITPIYPFSVMPKLIGLGLYILECMPLGLVQQNRRCRSNICYYFKDLGGVV